MENRLIFWARDKNGKLQFVSKFLSNIVPTVDQVWFIPPGEHKLSEEVQYVRMKVLTVEITVDSNGTDIDIIAEFCQSNFR